MIERLKQLYKYRQLIITLVSRELKARYRGTVFGFLWSFLNPLLLCAVFSIVFGVILPGSSGRVRDINLVGINYAIFLFTGLLPWLWFNSSILESANVLFVHGNLIKKIQFPVEVLPIMVVLTNMVHFLLGVPILILIIVFLGQGFGLTFWVFFFPVAVLVQFVFTMGLSLFVSALTVHFRDLKDILTNLLTLWFFATPIIYSLRNPNIPQHKPLVWAWNLNPMTHIIEAYQYTFVYRELPHWKKLPVTFIVGLICFYVGYLIFDKLRDTFVEEV
ncbi:MAG: ABC transporter permease [Candidatus Aminicenantes bacterium]|nr:ABC transporter permease [Candidatus Aminicenantes bacterium]NIM80959.1 ABC transporter permease [Candidatus Aminicenantes bacterium]NIN20341.1 ABC transporter permease [Candidatus Aminicenantes bacterium]NIN44116.1 ABC transporter permease [Candidatus Aminicenantes bacterium]NIN86929.1 ABC transporter permease [Candidatus Aminicenantes bacterium]